MLSTTKLKDFSHDSSSSMSRHLLDVPFHRGAPDGLKTQGGGTLNPTPRRTRSIRPGVAEPVPGVKYGQHLLEDRLRGRGISEHEMLLGLWGGRGAARCRGARGGPVAAARAVSLCTPDPERSVMDVNLGMWMHAA